MLANFRLSAEPTLFLFWFIAAGALKICLPVCASLFMSRREKVDLFLLAILILIAPA
jgi:hypothetical protein